MNVNEKYIKIWLNMYILFIGENISIILEN